MSLLDKLAEGLQDGTIKQPGKATKPTKPRDRLPGEPRRRGVEFDTPVFRDHWSQTNPPPTFRDPKLQVGNRFVIPVYHAYEPAQLRKARYPATAFIGCSPWWPNHLQLTE